MVWLRLILLVTGLLFIAMLIWWERRQPRQARSTTLRAERSEPSFDMNAHVDGLADAVATVEPGVSEPSSNEREVRRAPPIIDWSDAVSEASIAPIVTAVAEPPPAATPMTVDWPAENERRIVTLRILPAHQDRLAGRTLRQGLTACGFRHGQFGIFHLPEADGRVVLSAASLVRPGLLDPNTMDFQRFAGINVFAVLPGPLDNESALERLTQVAIDLAVRVDGRLQDESGAALTTAGVHEWRRRAVVALVPAGQTDR